MLKTIRSTPAVSGGIKIEKGIPIPNGYRKSDCPYPFSKMVVGDSFFIPFGKAKPESTRTYIIEVSRKWKKKTGKNWKFTSSMLSDKGGVRIWRVK